MKVKRYVASTSREALRQVKEELGNDAVILSNRKTKEGVEIMALADAEMSNLVHPPLAAPTSAPATIRTRNSFKNKAEAILADHALPTRSVSRDREPVNLKAQSEKLSTEFAQTIIAEIQAMKTTLEDQLANVAWGNFTQRKPEKAKILRTMLEAGFSPALSRRLVDKLTPEFNYEQSLKQAISALSMNLQTIENDEMIEKGGVYAMVGPTGVGKTTTTAKLAARCVIRHGADKVALLTTDSYRIGGHEQLRIYGQLLGIPVRNIKDTEDLHLTLSELKRKHMVLIDTVGMSQRDRMVTEQLSMLMQCGVDVKRVLILSAASNGKTLDEVISAYQKSGIHGCIITKVDETASLGVVLDAVIRRKLLLHYVANGQKVPEDIHAAHARYLLHRIFKSSQSDSAFTLQDAEFALIMANQGNDEASNSLKSMAGFSYD